MGYRENFRRKMLAPPLTAAERAQEKAIKQSQEEKIARLMAYYGLTLTIEKPSWSKDRWAKYAIVGPRKQVPSLVVDHCVASPGERATYGRGFRFRDRDAYGFNLTGSWPQFIETLDRYHRGLWPVARPEPKKDERPPNAPSLFI